MTKSNLYFSISMPFHDYLNQALEKEALMKHYDSSTKNNIWIFNIHKLSTIKAILNEKLIWDKLEIRKLIEFQDKEFLEEVKLMPYKGKDTLEFIEYPKFFRIISHRKNHDTGELKKIPPIDVTIEKLILTWTQIIKKYELEKRYEPGHTMEKINELFGFGSEVATNKPKIFRNTKFHQEHYWSVLKVLEYLGVIRYEKTGCVTRIKDQLEIQGKIIQ